MDDYNYIFISGKGGLPGSRKSGILKSLISNLMNYPEEIEEMSFLQAQIKSPETH